MAVRLSYKLIAVAPGWGHPKGESYRIHIEYASGRSMSLPGRFKSATEAIAYVKRFYPELDGRCTGVDELNKTACMRAAVNIKAPI